MADPIMALVVTVAILATAYDVFKHALATLSDHARIPDKDVRAVAMGVPGACRMPITSARAAPRERCTPTCTCSWRPG